MITGLPIYVRITFFVALAFVLVMFYFQHIYSLTYLKTQQSG